MQIQIVKLRRRHYFAIAFWNQSREALGQYQTRNNVEQLSRSTLLRNKVACLTSQVTQPLTSRATNLLDRNHLYSRQYCRATKLSEKVAQLCCVSDIGLNLVAQLYCRLKR